MGTTVVNGFAIFVHDQSSITDQVVRWKSFALEISFFEGYKGFTGIDRFHGVVGDFCIVALISKKGTPPAKGGFGWLRRGCCGIHNVGWCGQLV